MKVDLLGTSLVPFFIAMNKHIRFKKDEVEEIKKDPRVKYIDEYSIRFTLEFRQQLYDYLNPNFNNPSIREALVHFEFKHKIHKKILCGIVTSFRKRRPCGAANATLYQHLAATKVDKSYDVVLLSCGMFEKERKGITPSEKLLNYIFDNYPTNSVEESLTNLGFDVNRIGYQRIYNIEKEIKSPTPKSISFTDEQINFYRNHPYVKQITSKRLSFVDNFYFEARHFKHLHINEILSIFELNPDWINYSRKVNISYKINSFAGSITNPIEGNIDLLIKIETNKYNNLSNKANSEFEVIKSAINSSCRYKRHVCKLIDDIVSIEGSFFSKTELFNKLGVSKSVYYKIKNDPNYGKHEEMREKEDLKAASLIKEVIDENKYPKGNRMIYMILDREGHHMSRAKIYRLCEKYGIQCKVRGHNASRKAAQEMLKRNCKDNLVKRQFRLSKPGDIILTDVSYLNCGFGRAYLSATKDACTGEVRLNVSKSNDLNLVLDTLSRLPAAGKNAIFHSDQGVLYLNDAFQKKVEELGYIQSMSKRGNCWDNSPQESFFGHMKDEVALKACEDFDELVKEIAEYEYYYNNQRPQWTRNMMTPVEYREYINSMSDSEYQVYYIKEMAKYDKMMLKAKENAIKRSKNIGV